VSTSTPPSFEEIKGALHQIGHHLLQTQTSLLPDYRPPAGLVELERLNGILKPYHQAFLQKSRALYQALKDSDLNSPQGKTLVDGLKANLNTQLLDMDLREEVYGKSRKSFMNYEAGLNALEYEAKLGVLDRLLPPQDSAMVEKIALAPTLRPGLYALRFRYQEETVELAGAFVATEKNSPEVSDLLATTSVGRVLLFTPLRGIEPFDSLGELNSRLLQLFDHPTGRKEFMSLLPTRYHALTTAGVWPLELSPIQEKPLFEHLFDTQVNKRSEDIQRALSFADNPDKDPVQLMDALDAAIAITPPDFSARLELRAQTLLERHLRFSAPDWYRSANETRRAELASHLGQYNQARQALLDLMGPATTPHALARHQWLERLSDDLEIEDLLPEHLLVSTRRMMVGLGPYELKYNLIDLALRGLHTGDELPGSDFLKSTTLTYYDAPLPDAYQDITPAWLAQQLSTLQPRIDFAEVQKELHSHEETRRAQEHMLDRRINALAYTAVLQGHLTDDDFQLIQRLREGNDPQLKAACMGGSALVLHGAQLLDLWVLRQTDDDGAVKRLLLCTPEAPRAQQFMAFNNEADCQAHILGWAQGDMTHYLITRVPMRFRATLQTVLASLSFKPADREHQKITFNLALSHQACLRSMAEHIQQTRVDDYQFNSPEWFRSASAPTRRKLVTLAEDTENTLRAFNRMDFSEAQFPSFNSYLHEQAKKSLNKLLGRRQNDVDPNTVWAYSPPALIGNWTPAPLSYTELYRDGYDDGIGFLNEKFSRSARFRGPQGVDLTRLTAETVARSVTGTWVGQHYITKVRKVLLNSEDASYDLRRRAALIFTQWQMQSAAIESQLQGYITSADRQWLESSIASFGDSSPLTRNNYALHRLMIDGEWVIDTWLFSHGNNSTLLYTPQAPDGIGFRPAGLFNYLLKKQPGMIDYLTERVGVQSQGRVRTFLEEAKRGLPDNLDTTSTSPARYDTIRSVPAVADMRDALYNMRLQRKIDDVNATTVNPTQMITGILWTCVEWVAVIVTAPFPVLSLSAGLLLAFKDSMLALHAYNQGDTSAAFEHFLGYLFNSAGALATDLRPVLRSLNPMAKTLRLSTASAEQSRTLQLIHQLEPTPPAPAGMQPVIFGGRALWAPNTPDAIGRYLLYRLDPATGQLVSTSRLAAPNADGVWVRSGIAGGAPKYENVPETPGPHKDYGAPEKYWSKLELIIDPQFKTKLISDAEAFQIPVQMQLDNMVLELRSTRGKYQEQVARLATDADAFYKAFVPLPDVADVPAIEASTSFAEFIAGDAFTGSKHLIIGAVPGSIASKQVLISNLDVLIEKGFKTLYVEYLPGDVFYKKLNRINSTQASEHIKQHLTSVDKAFGLAKDAQFSYLTLVEAARKKGLKIRALDVSTGYHLDSALLMGVTPPTTPRANSLRNFYSHKAITADMAGAPQDRWVALVEHSRMRTFNRTPGMADLHDAVALRVEDVAPDKPVGLWVDKPGAIPGDAQAKGDYLLTMHTPYKAPPPAAAAPTPGVQHFSDFDIAPALREDIIHLSNTPHGLDSRYASFTSSHTEAYNSFIETRTRLQAKAQEAFANYAPPSRPALPAVTESTTPQAFFKQVGDSQFSGVVIGEGHGHESSKALLKTQMKSFKDAGFKTLYMEHLLTDIHQAELDIFHRTQRLPNGLKAYLRSQDIGHMPLYSGPDTYTAVVQAANKYGIRVRALDCAASYHLQGIGNQNLSRNQMFSYFAAKVIEADQAAQGTHKWIAFTGSAHTNNNLGVPGLAEMTGAVSLHVRDVSPTLARSIHPGYWETDLNNISTVALRSDFKLEVGRAGMHPPATPVLPERSRLTAEGMFLIERPSTAETRLVHLSRTDGIVTTPIQVDDNGMFFIDRWGQKEQRFTHLNTLIGMLRVDVKLTPAP